MWNARQREESGESTIWGFSNKKYRVSGQMKAILRTGVSFGHVEFEMLTRYESVTEVISCMYESVVWRVDWAGDILGDSLVDTLKKRRETSWRAPTCVQWK